MNGFIDDTLHAYHPRCRFVDDNSARIGSDVGREVASCDELPAQRSTIFRTYAEGAEIFLQARIFARPCKAAIVGPNIRHLSNRLGDLLYHTGLFQLATEYIG